MNRFGTEAYEQAKLIERRDATVKHKQEGCEVLRWLHAVPNGGQRHVLAARNMVSQGLTKGVADLALDVKRGGYSGLKIEMKSAKGKVTPEQSEYLIFAREQGFKTAVCYSCDEAWALICEYLGIKDVYK